jgi:hypothetical protein
MKRKQKIYSLVLALAAGAFILDRMTYSPDDLGPTEATAALQARSGSAGQSQTRRRQEPDETALDPQTFDGPGLGRKLRENCLTQRSRTPLGRDVFRPTSFWAPRPTADQQEKVDNQPSADQLALQKLADTYTLSATLAGENGAAILNDRCIRVGQKLNGCTLIAVTGGKAIFQAGPHKAIFHLTE